VGKIVVLGAAGFLGSHLCDRLIEQGEEVVGIDDLSTGSISNLFRLRENERFRFREANINKGFEVADNIDAVLNFASPASPPQYLRQPLHTLRTNSLGTEFALEVAVSKTARFIQASTSEVYGDPEVHPQTETYRGSVSSTGPRSCYDEGKRYAEALCMAYHRELGANIGIVRIFNTYGPRLTAADGRVVSNFITQALRGDPLTIYGTGLQTRSFCYVDDLVDGILKLWRSNETGPINLGNPTEFSVIELAELVLRLTASKSKIEYRDLPTDDPTQRCPDITLATTKLRWQPEVDLTDGISRTIAWFKSVTA